MAIPSESSKTPKTIYLIRHAQAEHNVRSEFHIPDAPLTALGRIQAHELLERYPFMGPDSAEYPEVIIASPLTRTIETALLAFEPLQPHLKVILMPELQENSDQACDTGSSIDVLSKRFPELSFEHIPKDWNSKSGRWASDDTSLDARALDALDRLSRREEQRIAVVTHGGFCSKLIQRWVRFENTECRVFKLVRGKRFSELQPVTMPGTEATRPLTTDMDAVGAMPQKDDGANFQDRSKPAP